MFHMLNEQCHMRVTYLHASNALERRSRVLTKSGSMDGALFVDLLDTSTTCLVHGLELRMRKWTQSRSALCGSTGNIGLECG